MAAHTMRIGSKFKSRGEGTYSWLIAEIAT